MRAPTFFFLATSPLFLGACAGAGSDDPEGGDDTADGEPEGPTPSDLMPLSSGECPDMSTTGLSSFLSSGEERTVSLVIPDGGAANSPVVFFFHGLLDPGSMPQPTEYMVSGLNLQDIADELGVVFVVPESPVQALYGYEFFMWDVWEESDKDVVLFDDLRTCVGQALDVDLGRLHATGFSGGALFTTILARDRGDALASIVELSGGADVQSDLLPGDISMYAKPAYAMPALLVSGGTSDSWPSGFEVVNFDSATDTLADHLVDDGHYVVRCRHTRGHDIPTSAWNDAQLWLESHEFGEPSPFIDWGIGDLQGDCEVMGTD
jgi:predicted esterase